MENQTATTPAPTPTSSFACYDLGNGMIELVVRVEVAGRYREVRWNEPESAEITRLFAELEAAAQKLEVPGPTAQ